MTSEPLFCRLNVSATKIRVAGLGRQWPHRIVRQLEPLDFSQEGDTELLDLLALLGPIQEVASQGQLIIDGFTKHKLRQA